MNKKNLLAILMSWLSVLVGADDLATNLMMMNSYSTRQNQDIWERIRVGFKMDHPQSDRVQYFEKMYTKNPKTFSRMMNNAKPYLYFLLNEIERNGLPSELVFIPGVESTFDPLAKNPTDAYAGMWQFVPSTGRRFNLTQNDQVDNRRDVIKSSKAALNYLNYLYTMFGQWDVAIGAYNWGEGGMYRAILNSGQPLGQVVYTNLQLRQITMDYVPKIIALASIIENPSKFGVTLDDTDDEPFFAIVNPATSITAADLTAQSGVDKMTFTRLNAQYKNDTYVFQQPDQILLPLANQSIYYASIGRSVPMESSPLYSSVEPLPASNNKVNASDLVAVGTVDQVGNKNIASAPVLSSVESSNIENSPSDTLDQLISTLNTDTSTAASDSNINSNAGNVSVNSDAAVPVSASQSPSGNISYTVTSGDTLYSIAKRFNADINEIRQQNHIPGNNLITGQTLIIKSNSSQSAV